MNGERAVPAILPWFSKHWECVAFAAFCLSAGLCFSGCSIADHAVTADEEEVFDGQPTGKTRAVIQTSLGDIAVVLFDDQAPEATANFLKLAREGFYRNQIFFRVKKHSLIQAGCPLGNGEGGPGYSLCNKDTGIPHFRYTVAMGKDGTQVHGSQFFIATAPMPWLDGDYPVFGKVVDGVEVVRKIEASEISENVADRPQDDVVILDIMIQPS